MPVRSMIQCAKQCAFNLRCDGLQFHYLLNITDSAVCSVDDVCEQDNMSAECILLEQKEFSQASSFQENTVIISKRGTADVKV